MDWEGRPPSQLQSILFPGEEKRFGRLDTTATQIDLYTSALRTSNYRKRHTIIRKIVVFMTTLGHSGIL